MLQFSHHIAPHTVGSQASAPITTLLACVTLPWLLVLALVSQGTGIAFKLQLLVYSLGKQAAAR